MTRENLLFAVIGALLGFIVGFMFASSVSQREMSARMMPGAQPAQNGELPPDHPPIQNAGGGSGGPQAMQAEVQAAIKRAREEPQNFEAQQQAASLFYQINRLDETLEFLKRANQARPDDYETIVAIGNINYDQGHYEEAANWYNQALLKKPEDTDVRTDLGLSFFLRNPPDVDRAIKEYRRALEFNPKHEKALQNLTVALTQKGDAKEAEATLKKLEEVNPSNSSLSKLRTDIEGLRSSKSTSK